LKGGKERKKANELSKIMLKYYVNLLVLNDKCFGKISNLFQIKNGKTKFSFPFSLPDPDKKAVYSLPFALRFGQAICL